MPQIVRTSHALQRITGWTISDLSGSRRRDGPEARAIVQLALPTYWRSAGANNGRGDNDTR